MRYICASTIRYLYSRLHASRRFLLTIKAVRALISDSTWTIELLRRRSHAAITAIDHCCFCTTRPRTISLCISRKYEKVIKDEFGLAGSALQGRRPISHTRRNKTFKLSTIPGENTTMPEQQDPIHIQWREISFGSQWRSIEQQCAQEHRPSKGKPCTSYTHYSSSCPSPTTVSTITDT